jgi:hypothetical protein
VICELSPPDEDAAARFAIDETALLQHQDRSLGGGDGHVVHVGELLIGRNPGRGLIVPDADPGGDIVGDLPISQVSGHVTHWSGTPAASPPLVPPKSSARPRELSAQMIDEYDRPQNAEQAGSPGRGPGRTRDRHRRR